MRFAILTDTFPPDINGVAMSLGRLAQGLADRGHEIEVFRPRPARTRTNAAEADQAFREFGVAGLPVPGYRGLRLALPQRRRLGRRWAKVRPDAVYVATEGALGKSAVVVARQLDIPVVSGYHTHFAQYAGHYRLPMISRAVLGYLRKLHNRTAMTLVPTPRLAEELGRLGFDNTKVLGRGVDTALFHPDRRSGKLRAAWGAGPEDPVAIYVGRIAPEKNLPLALGSLRQLRAAHPRLKVVVVGDGPARPNLARRFPEVIWTGARTGEDLAIHYASADLFAFPSESETYGNVVVEAMASGLVPVAYDLAAAHDLILNRTNGFLAEPGDRLSFRDALRKGLAAQAAWPAIRTAAQASAAHLGWDAVVAQFESYLSGAASPALQEPPSAAREPALA